MLLIQWSRLNLPALLYLSSVTVVIISLITCYTLRYCVQCVSANNRITTGEFARLKYRENKTNFSCVQLNQQQRLWRIGIWTSVIEIALCYSSNRPRSRLDSLHQSVLVELGDTGAMYTTHAQNNKGRPPSLVFVGRGDSVIGVKRPTPSARQNDRTPLKLMTAT